MQLMGYLVIISLTYLIYYVNITPPPHPGWGRRVGTEGGGSAGRRARPWIRPRWRTASLESTTGSLTHTRRGPAARQQWKGGRKYIQSVFLCAAEIKHVIPSDSFLPPRVSNTLRPSQPATQPLSAVATPLYGHLSKSAMPHGNESCCIS